MFSILKVIVTSSLFLKTLRLSWMSPVIFFRFLTSWCSLRPRSQPCTDDHLLFL